jgi:hypothetical protein
MKKYLIEALYFSNLSYNDNSWIKDNLNKKNYKLNKYDIKCIDYIKKNNLSVNIINKYELGLPNILHCKKNNILFISFPGIRNNYDKINCLNFKLKYIHELKSNIHCGFSNIFYKLKDEIDLLINIYKNDIDTVSFSGHSLGGIITKIFALYCELNYNFKIYCYTFACPLGGDETFTNAVNMNISNLFNLCCEKDFLIKLRYWKSSDERKKFMIKNNLLVKYENLTYDFLLNMIRFKINSHKLKYYIDFIEEKNFDLNI